jgi:hypothetical protein
MPQVVQQRIASREEVLQTLTGYMHTGEPKGSVRRQASGVRRQASCSSSCCLRLARDLVYG